MNHLDSAPGRSLLDLPVRELLDLLASSAPAPGGGAAAALAGALGAALVEMTANLTLGRPRYAEAQETARALAARATELRSAFARDVDADARAYQAVAAAYRLPRGTEHERLERAAAIQRALLEAARVPREVAERGAALLQLAEEAAPVLNITVISDVVVGALLGLAALEGAAENVEVNLASMEDATTREALAAALREARAGSEARVARVRALARQRAG